MEIASLDDKLIQIPRARARLSGVEHLGAQHCNWGEVHSLPHPETSARSALFLCNSGSAVMPSVLLCKSLPAILVIFRDPGITSSETLNVSIRHTVLCSPAYGGAEQRCCVG